MSSKRKRTARVDRWYDQQVLQLAIQRSRRSFRRENAGRSLQKGPSLDSSAVIKAMGSSKLNEPLPTPTVTYKRGIRKRRKYGSTSLEVEDNADENSKKAECIGEKAEENLQEEASKLCPGTNESSKNKIFSQCSSDEQEPQQTLQELDRIHAGVEADGSTKEKLVRKSLTRRSGKKKRKKDIVRTHFKIREPGKLAEELQGPKADKIHLIIDDEHESLCKERRKDTVAYPSSNDPDAVEVDATDLECLCETEYLNDTVMDFYIKHLQIIRSSASESCYHVFNSFFFTKLAEAVCIENQMTRLRKWTKGVDIFEKTYLIMPVHHKLHWSLAIICFLEPPRPESYGRCCILHLDSMKTGHDSRVVYEVLRRYLSAEWKLHHNGQISATPKNIHVRKVKVPQQANGYDCGLFVLHFLEQFVENAPARFDLELVKDMGNWFKANEASELRVIIRQLLEKVVKAEGRALTNRTGETSSSAIAAATTVVLVDQAAQSSSDFGRELEEQQ